MMFKKIAIVAGLGLALCRHGGGPDAAQGRHHPHDGALWLKFHQHGHSYDPARPGRDLRQRPAPVALHLGLRRGQAGSGACQGGHRLGRRSCLYLQAARRRLFPPWPQDDGRRHHLELQSHHGRRQGLSRRAFCPPDRGRGRGREGPGQRNLRPEEDRRLHARNEADRESRSRLLLLHRADFDLSRRRGAPRRASSRSRSVLGRSNLSSTCRDRASFWSGGTGSTSPASPTPTSSSCRSWAKPRRATSPSATRKSTPRCWDPRSMSPTRPTPTSRAPSSKSPRSSRVTWG